MKTYNINDIIVVNLKSEEIINIKFEMITKLMIERQSTS